MTPIRDYVRDPFLSGLMGSIRAAGSMRSSLLDITHKCNLRCRGCYFFTEGMDRYRKPRNDAAFTRFLEKERSRGTNLLNVVGGEPALEVERLRLLAEHFHLVVVTNGTLPIPMEGLENIRIAVSFWGDEDQDVNLRGSAKRVILDQALELYGKDPRAGFYYTTLPGYPSGIQRASERIINSGSFVTYNFYGDLASMGGRYDHRGGFHRVIAEIDEVTRKYPTSVVSSPYTNRVISARRLKGQSWGYDVCPSLTFDHPKNRERMRRGKQYPTKFRAYAADLETTRRCCIGEARDCGTCTDLWATSGWVQGSLRAHLQSRQDFTNWLTSTFLFYMQTGLIDYRRYRHWLPELYSRVQQETERVSGPETRHLPLLHEERAQTCR